MSRADAVETPAFIQFICLPQQGSELKGQELTETAGVFAAITIITIITIIITAFHFCFVILSRIIIVNISKFSLLPTLCGCGTFVPCHTSAMMNAAFCFASCELAVL